MKPIKTRMYVLRVLLDLSWNRMITADERALYLLKKSLENAAIGCDNLRFAGLFENRC
ncbi:MAG: hypothetical protein PHQ72_07105 [Hespellia sp.]|nr:hypothetical protein [Hespellia sp.]